MRGLDKLIHPGHRGTGGKRGGKEGPHPQTLYPGEVEDFLRGELMFVQSSNVAAAQYFAGTRQLMVEFLAKGNGKASAYLYDDVSEQEAVAFALAGSKGRFVWDYLRVRGDATGSRKNYRRIK